MRRVANALVIEPEEAPVISNEALEAHVVSIRTDFTDLKADFRGVVSRIDQDIRATAAKLESEVKATVARFDEQFREVRQDIRELRADNKTLRDKIDDVHASLSAKIDGNYTSLDKKIDANHAELSAKIDKNYASLDQKIETKFGELAAGMQAIRSDVADLKSMQKAIFWFVGSLGILAALVSVANSLHWI